MSISWFQSLTSKLGEHVPAFLVPFISLSYPTDTPTNLDSFHDAQYYKTGPLDACLIISCIAVMAVLRDATRLGIMEPFAKWKLSRDLHLKRVNRNKSQGLANGGKANGNGHHANGDIVQMSKRESRQMHRSVIRFAEQGWSALYYAIQWTYGIVSFFYYFFHFYFVLLMCCIVRPS
jgi:acyl-CoA-dependent ceramide synthase